MGREGFEPPKGFPSGFTARPIWPLWYLPTIEIVELTSLPSSLYHIINIFKASERIRTPDPLITNQLLYQLSYAGIFFCLRAFPLIDLSGN
jgi:hypothetical protein